MLSSAAQNNIEVLIAGADSHMTGYRPQPGSTRESLEHSIGDGAGAGAKVFDAFQVHGLRYIYKNVVEKKPFCFNCNNFLPHNTCPTCSLSTPEAEETCEISGKKKVPQIYLLKFSKISDNFISSIIFPP